MVLHGKSCRAPADGHGDYAWQLASIKIFIDKQYNVAPNHNTVRLESIVRYKYLFGQP